MSLQLSGSGVVTGLDSLASSDLGTVLGSKLDTTAYQPGLTLITSQTFSAVSSVSINGCFSATYSYYKIFIRVEGSTGSNFAMRGRTSGSDDTGSNYDRQTMDVSDTVFTGARSVDQTSLTIGNVRNGAVGDLEVTCAFPFEAENTHIFSVNRDIFNQALMLQMVGRIQTTTSYDGFTIFPGSGTITGNLVIYGFRK
jgi:hypothetical protein